MFRKPIFDSTFQLMYCFCNFFVLHLWTLFKSNHVLFLSDFIALRHTVLNRANAVLMFVSIT